MSSHYTKSNCFSSSNSKAMQKLPKSPKFFYPQRTSTCNWISRFRRFASSPIFPCICLAFGVFGVIFGSVGISLYGLRKCPGLGLPATLSVAWDGNGGRNKGSEMDVFGENQRHKVMAFVGIQTGFSSVGRRKALRKTWMPSDRDELRRLEESTGLAFRFVIGRSSDRSKMASLEKEIHEYDDFLLIDLEEQYSKLPFKTLAFFKAAYRLYDCDFYVKADDDIYLRPDRLSLLLAKDRSHPQTYLGCMKKGVVFTDPKHKWYEPLSPLLGSQYFLHAYGPIYALSSDTVSNLILVRNDSFRMFSNEDVMIGSWMLAMNVEHEHEKELCQTQCTTSSIAVWDIPKCSGLCHPEQQLIELHQMDICSNSPTMAFND